jgi:nucleoside-diphosphate-sugar epimerase
LDFYDQQSGAPEMELTVMNPVSVYGRRLAGNLFGTCMGLMTSMILGKKAQVPNGNYIMSDLRDIATIHVIVLENEASNCRRLTFSSDKKYSFMKIATKLKMNGYLLLIDKR